MSAADAVVLVTARSFGGTQPQLRQRLEDAVREVRWNERGRPLRADELRAALEDVDGVIAGVDRFDASAIESARRLRVIARHGTGTDGVDLAAARRRGILVTNTPGANADAVAELAIALVFVLARRVVEADRRVRAGAYGPLLGVQLAGRTVGVLGLGHVGAAVSRRAAALGCRVLGFDPVVDAEQVGATSASFQSVVTEADFLTLHVPLTPSTHDMVNAELLGRIKQGARLVNTARGELIVEPDLLAALDSGRLAGAALDTLRDEPPDPGHPLLARDDVVITPHVGADTEEARRAMGAMALDDLLAVLDGRPPRHPVGEGESGS